MVMVMNAKRTLGALVAAPVFGLLLTSSVAAAPEVCNGRTARALANAGDYTGLCDCAQVTPSFLRQLQRRSDFETTLSVTSAQCPALATLLTDLPTASISAATTSRGEDRNSDPGGDGGGAGGAETRNRG